jgi:hypothetical protein
MPFRTSYAIKSVTLLLGLLLERFLRKTVRMLVTTMFLPLYLRLVAVVQPLHLRCIAALLLRAIPRSNLLQRVRRLLGLGG